MLHSNLSVNEKGHLTLCGADTVALAEKYGPPLYRLDEDRIRAKCRSFRSSSTTSFHRLSPSLSTWRTLLSASWISWLSIRSNN